MGVDWGVLHFRLANWFLSCCNCSSKSAKGWQVSVSSQYSSDESLSPYGTQWSCGMRSKGDKSLVSGTSSLSQPPYLITMPSVLWYIPKGYSRAFRGDCLQSWDVCVALVVHMMRWKSLTRWLLWWAWSSSVQVKGFAKWCWWDPISDMWVLDLFTARYLWLFHCEVSQHSTSVKIQNGCCTHVKVQNV